MQLRNQHVFITGGSSGIGLALARRAAAEGARVTILARDPARLAAAEEEIRRHAPSAPPACVIAADVAHQSEVLVGSSRVDLQACKLEYSIVSPK